MYNKINQDLMTARKAKDKMAVTFLSTLKGEIGRLCDGKPETLTDDQVIKVIRKMADNLKEVIAVKSDEQAVAELKILEAYLPQMMDESQIRAIVENEIRTVGAESMKDMGKVMGKLKVHAATMDMKIASGMIKEILS